MYCSVHHKTLATVLLSAALLFAFPTQAGETIELRLGCTLNDAIRAANTNQPVGACKAGDPGRDHIYVHDTVEILESPVEITEDLGVVGDRFTSTLDGRGRFSFFRVGPGVDLHIQDLFMSNGYGTRESGQVRVGSGGRVYFSTVKVINCKGVKEIIADSEEQVHIGLAVSICGKTEPFNPHLPVVPLPDPDDESPSDDGDDSPRQTKKNNGKPAERNVKPETYTCEHLPANIRVRPIAGTRSGIQCQVLDAGGVGRQDLIDAGIIVAVDIWGYVDPGVEVCLPGLGELLFLDAAFAPRQPAWIDTFQQGNRTCARFTRAGSLVLLSSVPDGIAPRQVSEGCEVRTLAVLNFSKEPDGSTILRHIPADVTVTVASISAGWLKTTYGGWEGWISAAYVESTGACG